MTWASPTPAFGSALATQFATMQVYQPAVLALMATDTALFRISRHVAFLDLRPLKRTRVFNDHARFAHPRLSNEQTYGDRPRKMHRGVDIANMICITFHTSIVTLSQHQTKKLRGKLSNLKWLAALDAWLSAEVDATLCPLDADAAEERPHIPLEVRAPSLRPYHACANGPNLIPNTTATIVTAKQPHARNAKAPHAHPGHYMPCMYTVRKAFILRVNHSTHTVLQHQPEH